MKDKDNPNIEYPQINLVVVLLAILWIILMGMGSILVTVYLINALIANVLDSLLAIILSVTNLYLIVSFVFNIVLLHNALHMRIENNVKSNAALAFSSFNIGAGVVICVKKR